MLRRIAAALVVVQSAGSALADETLVAVAANFTEAAKEISAAFTAETGHGVRFSFGPTGLLYAQITQDAPFEVFLAGDQVRPEKADMSGLTVPGTRFIPPRNAGIALRFNS